jgi:hypothetical protein
MKPIYLRLFVFLLIFNVAPAPSRGFDSSFGEQVFSVDGTGPCVTNPNYTTVSPGQSIQSAVGQAKPGTVIRVKPGIYSGCIDLSGLHGEDRNPIILISEIPHAARIVGDSSCAAIFSLISKGGISNLGVYGFTIVANTNSGDFGGVKIAGPWKNPVHNVAFVGNEVTGVGEDGMKFFNGANNLIIAGNTNTGKWRQEAFDNVSIERSIFAFNTTSAASATYTSLTLKGASRNIEVVGNDFRVVSSTSFRPTQISVGGYGKNFAALKQPDYWAQPFQAKNVRIHDNKIGGPNSVVFAGGIDSVLENNSLAGGVAFSCGADDRFTNEQKLCGSPSTDAVRNNSGPRAPVGAENLPVTLRVCPGRTGP